MAPLLRGKPVHRTSQSLSHRHPVRHLENRAEEFPTPDERPPQPPELEPALENRTEPAFLG
jgi:hypothetical protein